MYFQIFKCVFWNFNYKFSFKSYRFSYYKTTNFFEKIMLDLKVMQQRQYN